MRRASRSATNRVVSTGSEVAYAAAASVIAYHDFSVSDNNNMIVIVSHYHHSRSPFRRQNGSYDRATPPTP